MQTTRPLDDNAPRTGALHRSMTGIYRIDRDDLVGWLVSLQRQNRLYARKFSDRRYGGANQALEAAHSYREGLLAQHPRMTRRAQCAILKEEQSLRRVRCHAKCRGGSSIKNG